MASETTPEATAIKRKRGVDENGERKRRKRDRGPKKPKVEDGQPPVPEPADQANGLEEALADDSDHDQEKALDIFRPDGKVKKQEKHRHRSRAWNSGAARDDARRWRVSKPIGGRMLNIDPILSEDEKHLILAYNTSLQVYSAPESLLLRKIQLSLAQVDGRRDQIIAVCPSATSSNLLWVTSYGGHLWLIDWKTGAGSEVRMLLDCDRVHDMFVDSAIIGSTVRDMVYISAKKGEAWHIIAHDIRNLEVVGSKTIFSHTSAIENLRVAHLGHTFAAYSERNIILGSRIHNAMPNFEDLAYEVVTLDASDEITCLDIRVTNRVHLNRKSQREASDAPVIDVVIGCARGALFAYNDLLPQIRLLNDPKARRHALQPHKYHWHRKAVHAVKWSRDGNYILSGGSESTMVLWQLDTQKMDFLPHLSAAIENIVVSKRGSAYALHLDDNSAMVLSTAEMKPITYITGIQALLSPRPASKNDSVRRIGQFTPDRLIRIPAVMSPSNPSQMLLCVGNGQQLSYSGSGPSMPLIQALDLTTMQSVSKQALTRTNPTDVNTTSRGHPITEPRVTGMIYSHDGRWLLTTDEWQPPSRDVNSLEGLPSERREVYLKFWSVSAESQGLELMTRIDAPHGFNPADPVFDLAADPKLDRFATVGGDGVARLWQPTIRQKHGLPVKGKNGRPLYSWQCSQAVSLYDNETTGDLKVPSAFQGSGAVKFSEDGSVLVCAVVHEHGSIVQVVDTESGSIRNSLNGLIIGTIQGISILSTNLIVVSDVLLVYDLVLDELRYGVQLRRTKDSKGEALDGPGASIIAHLAADLQTGRFAVSVSKGKRRSTKVRSELAIFSPDECEPELVQRFPNPITSLIPSTGSSGFFVLDSAAQIWSVAESMDTKSIALAQPLTDLQLDQEPIGNGEATSAPALLLEEDDDQASEGGMDVDITDATDGDTIYPAVVAPQRLAALFDVAPSFAMPPIEDMFYQVTKMFAAKAAIAAS
ncbi:WD40-repeat-containing domain protein [Nemania sp. NC0429]|nr:WD40-repeat-containing domain protein [Nemania sp. NC0429]